MVVDSRKISVFLGGQCFDPNPPPQDYSECLPGELTLPDSMVSVYEVPDLILDLDTSLKLMPAYIKRQPLHKELLRAAARLYREPNAKEFQELERAVTTLEDDIMKRAEEPPDETRFKKFLTDIEEAAVSPPADQDDPDDVAMRNVARFETSKRQYEKMSSHLTPQKGKDGVTITVGELKELCAAIERDATEILTELKADPSGAFGEIPDEMDLHGSSSARQKGTDYIAERDRLVKTARFMSEWYDLPNADPDRKFVLGGEELKEVRTAVRDIARYVKLRMGPSVYRLKDLDMSHRAEILASAGNIEDYAVKLFELKLTGRQKETSAVLAMIHFENETLRAAMKKEVEHLRSFGATKEELKPFDGRIEKIFSAGKALEFEELSVCVEAMNRDFEELEFKLSVERTREILSQTANVKKLVMAAEVFGLKEVNEKGFATARRALDGVLGYLRAGEGERAKKLYAAFVSSPLYAELMEVLQRGERVALVEELSVLMASSIVVVMSAGFLSESALALAAGYIGKASKIKRLGLAITSASAFGNAERAIRHVAFNQPYFETDSLAGWVEEFGWDALNLTGMFWAIGLATRLPVSRLGKFAAEVGALATYNGISGYARVAMLQSYYDLDQAGAHLKMSLSPMEVAKTTMFLGGLKGGRYLASPLSPIGGSMRESIKNHHEDRLIKMNSEMERLLREKDEPKADVAEINKKLARLQAARVCAFEKDLMTDAELARMPEKTEEEKARKEETKKQQKALRQKIGRHRQTQKNVAALVSKDAARKTIAETYPLLVSDLGRTGAMVVVNDIALRLITATEDKPIEISRLGERPITIRVTGHGKDEDRIYHDINIFIGDEFYGRARIFVNTRTLATLEGTVAIREFSVSDVEDVNPALAEDFPAFAMNEGPLKLFKDTPELVGRHVEEQAEVLDAKRIWKELTEREPVFSEVTGLTNGDITVEKLVETLVELACELTRGVTARGFYAGAPEMRRAAEALKKALSDALTAGIDIGSGGREVLKMLAETLYRVPDFLLKGTVLRPITDIINEHAGRERELVRSYIGRSLGLNDEDPGFNANLNRSLNELEPLEVVAMLYRALDAIMEDLGDNPNTEALLALGEMIELIDAADMAAYPVLLTTEQADAITDADSRSLANVDVVYRNIDRIRNEKREEAWTVVQTLATEAVLQETLGRHSSGGVTPDQPVDYQTVLSSSFIELYQGVFGKNATAESRARMLPALRQLIGIIEHIDENMVEILLRNFPIYVEARQALQIFGHDWTQLSEPESVADAQEPLGKVVMADIGAGDTDILLSLREAMTSDERAVSPLNGIILALAKAADGLPMPDGEIPFVDSLSGLDPATISIVMADVESKCGRAFDAKDPEHVEAYDGLLEAMGNAPDPDHDIAKGLQDLDSKLREALRNDGMPLSSDNARNFGRHISALENFVATVLGRRSDPLRLLMDRIPGERAAIIIEDAFLKLLDELDVDNPMQTEAIRKLGNIIEAHAARYPVLVHPSFAHAMDRMDDILSLQGMLLRLREVRAMTGGVSRAGDVLERLEQLTRAVDAGMNNRTFDLGNAGDRAYARTLARLIGEAQVLGAPIVTPVWCALLARGETKAEPLPPAEPVAAPFHYEVVPVKDLPAKPEPKGGVVVGKKPPSETVARKLAALARGKVLKRLGKVREKFALVDIPETKRKLPDVPTTLAAFEKTIEAGADVVREKVAQHLESPDFGIDARMADTAREFLSLVDEAASLEMDLPALRPASAGGLAILRAASTAGQMAPESTEARMRIFGEMLGVFGEAKGMRTFASTAKPPDETSYLNRLEELLRGKPRAASVIQKYLDIFQIDLGRFGEAEYAAALKWLGKVTAVFASGELAPAPNVAVNREVSSFGDAKIGTVIHLAAIHGIPELRDPAFCASDPGVSESTKKFVIAQQASVLQELLRLGASHVFDEGLTAEILPDGESWEDNDLVLSEVQRIARENGGMGPEQAYRRFRSELRESLKNGILSPSNPYAEFIRNVLLEYSAAYLYYYLRDDVTLHMTTSEDEKEQDERALRSEALSTNEDVADAKEGLDRENRAMGYVNRFLAEHPGETVALTFGYLHSFDHAVSGTSAPMIETVRFPELEREHERYSEITDRIGEDRESIAEIAAAGGMFDILVTSDNETYSIEAAPAAPDGQTDVALFINGRRIGSVNVRINQDGTGAVVDRRKNAPSTGENAAGAEESPLQNFVRLFEAWLAKKPLPVSDVSWKSMEVAVEDLKQVARWAIVAESSSLDGKYFVEVKNAGSEDHLTRGKFPMQVAIRPADSKKRFPVGVFLLNLEPDGRVSFRPLIDLRAFTRDNSEPPYISAADIRQAIELWARNHNAAIDARAKKTSGEVSGKGSYTSPPAKGPSGAGRRPHNARPDDKDGTGSGGPGGPKLTPLDGARAPSVADAQKLCLQEAGRHIEEFRAAMKGVGQIREFEGFLGIESPATGREDVNPVLWKKLVEFAMDRAYDLVIKDIGADTHAQPFNWEELSMPTQTLARAVVRAVEDKRIKWYVGITPENTRYHFVLNAALLPITTTEMVRNSPQIEPRSLIAKLRAIPAKIGRENKTAAAPIATMDNVLEVLADTLEVVVEEIVIRRNAGTEVWLMRVAGIGKDLILAARELDEIARMAASAGRHLLIERDDLSNKYKRMLYWAARLIMPDEELEGGEPEPTPPAPKPDASKPEKSGGKILPFRNDGWHNKPAKSPDPADRLPFGEDRKPALAEIPDEVLPRARNGRHYKLELGEDDPNDIVDPQNAASTNIGLRENQGDGFVVVNRGGYRYVVVIDGVGSVPDEGKRARQIVERVMKWALENDHAVLEAIHLANKAVVADIWGRYNVRVIDSVDNETTALLTAVRIGPDGTVESLTIGKCIGDPVGIVLSPPDENGERTILGWSHSWDGIGHAEKVRFDKGSIPEQTIAYYGALPDGSPAQELKPEYKKIGNVPAGSRVYVVSDGVNLGSPELLARLEKELQKKLGRRATDEEVRQAIALDNEIGMKLFEYVGESYAKLEHHTLVAAWKMAYARVYGREPAAGEEPLPVYMRFKDNFMLGNGLIVGMKYIPLRFKDDFMLGSEGIMDMEDGSLRYLKDNYTIVVSTVGKTEPSGEATLFAVHHENLRRFLAEGQARKIVFDSEHHGLNATRAAVRVVENRVDAATAEELLGMLMYLKEFMPDGHHGLGSDFLVHFPYPQGFEREFTVLRLRIIRRLLALGERADFTPMSVYDWLYKYTASTRFEHEQREDGPGKDIKQIRLAVLKNTAEELEMQLTGEK